MIVSGKRSGEHFGTFKDQSAKKKNRTIQRDRDERDKIQAFKTVVVHSTNAGQVDVCDSKVDKVFEFDVLEGMHEHGKDTGSQEVASTVETSIGECQGKPQRNAASDDENNAPISCKVSRLISYSSHKRFKAEKVGLEASNSAKSEEVTLPAPVKDDAIAGNSVKKEGKLSPDNDRNPGEQLETKTNGLPGAKGLNEVVNFSLEVQDPEVKGLYNGMLLSSCKAKSGTNAYEKKFPRSYPSDTVAKSDCIKNMSEQVQSACHESENFKINGTGPISSQSEDQEGQDAREQAIVHQFEKSDEVTDYSSNSKLQYEGLESSMEVTKIPLELKELPKGAGDTMKHVGALPSSPPSQCITVSAGKSSSSSSTVISKFSISNRNSIGNCQSSRLNGKEMTSNSTIGMKKDGEHVELCKGQDKHERTKSTVKPNPKSSLNSVLKASKASGATNSPSFKHYNVGGKNSSRLLSSKSSSAGGSPHSSDISEPSAVQHQCTVHGPTKNIASSVQQQGEKAPQSNSQSSSKSTTSTSGKLAANSPSGLTDEGLALLLHQELINSSPRVPRVPRVRNTGSLPQLSSACPTSMLIKRASSSRGKEQYAFSRRKSKDLHEDDSRSSLEHDTEARKGDRVLSPSDSAKASDAEIAGNPEM